METQFRLSGFVCRTLMFSAVLGAGVAVMSAQQAASATSASPTPAAQTLNVSAAASQAASDAAYSSSATTNAPNDEIASASDHFNFAGAMNAMQYGGRSRYGRPRYRGGNTNPDGSNKYEFYGGAGFTVPTQKTSDVDSVSWGIQVGAGRNFNKHVGVNLEFDWDNFGLQGNTLNAQQNLYNGYISIYDANYTAGPSDPNYISPIAGLDGYSHVWSISLQPIYNIAVNQGLGAYVTGGVGFYHKITTFTQPAVGTYCDPFYGYCYDYQANQPIDSYTSNAPGVDVGMGFTYKFSHFSNERLYGEVRYVYMFNQYRPGIDATVDTPTLANFAVLNDYPANSERTSYIPVKFGIRF